MKTKLKLLILLPLFALLMFSSCQNEVIDVTAPTESEAITAESDLAKLVESTSKMDGSKDNILDKASCLSVHLPVTVMVKGLEVKINTEADLQTIETIFKEFDDDVDKVDFIFPITIILSNHEQVVIQSPQALAELAAQCNGENEPDDDIECIDFQYPISFSIYDSGFQVLDVKTIESDEQLHHFIHRVRTSEVFASLNFPVIMKLADGASVVVNSNAQLHRTIQEAKDLCDEDDDNDYGDDDFTPERLNNYLMACPWVVHDFERNALDLTLDYRDFGLKFMPEGVVHMRKINGEILTGFWRTRLTDRGALLELAFEGLPNFSFELVVYDIEDGVIKLYEVGGNRIIMKRNCGVVKGFIEGFLQECLWRVDRINIDGIDHEREYIGTPLKFFPDNIVKMTINGELVQGAYEVFPRDLGFILKVMLPNRPHLQLDWFVTILEPGLIKLENATNQMILERHCPFVDNDLNYVNDILMSSMWTVTEYIVNGVNMASEFSSYNLEFIQDGRVKAIDSNFGIVAGGWLSYRKDGLNLGLNFGPNAPFDDLNHRWKIVELTPSQIILHQYNLSGETVKELVLDKKI